MSESRARHLYLRLAACLALLACLLSWVAGAEAAKAADWQPLVAQLIADGADAAQAEAVFAASGVAYDPGAMGRKLRALYEQRFLPPGPEEPEPGPETWLAEQGLSFTAERLVKAVVFRLRHSDTLAQVQAEYGVDAGVVLAILVKESKLGEFLGDRPAAASLGSMALARDWEDVASYVQDLGPTDEQQAWLKERQAERADWAYVELIALLEYARENRMDAATLPGSVYGAIGLCQFLPSNALALGVDGDGDGRVDLFEPVDAMHSVANFLKQAGWVPGLSEDEQVRVLLRYNNDEHYARTILAIASRL